MKSRDDEPLRAADVQELELTPMMRHYLEEKQKRPDCLLFYRLGDFFELFFDDALLVSKELGLTLTARDCGLERKAPMCGVPHHAAEQYIKRLLENGHKIAICEQMEDPAQAKGMVRREVVRVVSPGTVTDPEMLDALSYRYIAAVCADGDYYGLAFADLSASRFLAAEILSSSRSAKLIDELERMNASEIICNQAFADSELCQAYLQDHPISQTCLQEEAFGLQDLPAAFHYLSESGEALWAKAAAGLLRYLESSRCELPQDLPRLRPYCVEKHLILDQTARRHLEISRTLRSGERRGSLLWALDLCKTGMGSRLLKERLEQPLLDIGDIEARLDVVEAFKEDYVRRSTLREILEGVYDLERLAGRLALGSAGPRDLASIARIQGRIPEIKALLAELERPAVQAMAQRLDPLSELTEKLNSELNDELPVFARDGGVFRAGANAELDELRSIAKDGKSYLLEYEARERERSGIKSLKLKYNRVFGYAIEITHANRPLVPDHYIRKQTLANAERYVTEELKQLEERILGAEQKALSLEQELFECLRAACAARLPALRENAAVLALSDLSAALGELAERSGACRPRLFSDSRLIIRDGRHPVVEKMLRGERFVPNDLEMNGEDRRLMILTGPNMAGKSTFMRQNALLVLMAQAGLFVPAEAAEIGLVDQIFTRVGASDDLGSGQSTFMVEMNEVADILRRATPRSLLILDEIGRGTSTWDGLSIAWSCIEHIADKKWLGSRCLFATHYHELTDLEEMLDGVYNCHVDIARDGKKLIFLHEIRAGGSDSSYGIDVARLAGVPESVTLRAQDLLLLLEKENQGKRLRIRKSSEPIEGQLDLFSAARSWSRSDDFMRKIEAFDLDRMRPLEALGALAELQEEARHLLPSLGEDA